jgi:hypothetical protein
MTREGSKLSKKLEYAQCCEKGISEKYLTAEADLPGRSLLGKLLRTRGIVRLPLFHKDR